MKNIFRSTTHFSGCAKNLLLNFMQHYFVKLCLFHLSLPSKADPRMRLFFTNNWLEITPIFSPILKKWYFLETDSVYFNKVRINLCPILVFNHRQRRRECSPGVLCPWRKMSAVMMDSWMADVVSVLGLLINNDEWDRDAKCSDLDCNF